MAPGLRADEPSKAESHPRRAVSVHWPDSSDDADIQE